MCQHAVLWYNGYRTDFLDFEMQPNFLPYPIIAESIESPIISPDDIFAIQIRDFSRNVTIEQAEQVSGHIKY